MKQSFKALMVATAAASIALFDAADAQLVCTAYSKEELGGNKWPTTDAKCAKCAEGYQWWPCDTDLCKCEESTDDTPEPTSVPTPQPTGAPVVCTAYSKEELGGNKWPTTDAKCAKCAEGYQWWPCDTDLCKCEESTDGTPEPEPTSVPTPQPTGAPVVRVRAVSTSSPTDAQCLNNNHFADGTFIIDQPGSYKLCDDIIFCPHNIDVENASDEQIAESFDPISQGDPKYNKNEYALGFFAAIAVTADDVSISLNGHSIAQCREHALMQRFFAVIELASAPFIPDVGPHNFVSTEFKAAKNFKLTGPGTVGLSSHHGIHGNENENIQISDVTFKDFEVGAVSLNNVKGLEIKNCVIPHNRQDVPILGSFSAALKIRPYLKRLLEIDPFYSMTLGGTTKSARVVYDTLIRHIAHVYKDVMQDGFIDPTTHPVEYQLYNNPHQVIDGPCYVFLVHGKGPAVGGFGEEQATDRSLLSTDVNIVNNHAQNIKCFTNEVLATVVDGAVQNDARGAVMQFYDASDETYIGMEETLGQYIYIGNANLDAQIMVGKAINQDLASLGDNVVLQTNVNSVNNDLIAWAEGEDPSYTPKFRCNGDSMHHVVKGSIMMRVEDCQGFNIMGNTINNVEILSVGAVPAEMCEDFHLGASSADGSDRMLADVRGISVAAVSAYNDTLQNGNDASMISHNTITNFKSQSAQLIAGVDIQGFSEGVDIENNYVDLDSTVGNISMDKWVGLRIRASASAIFVHSNNIFVQGEVQESRRKLMPEYHPRPAGDSEWPNNGCPFGH